MLFNKFLLLFFSYTHILFLNAVQNQNQNQNYYTDKTMCPCATHTVKMLHKMASLHAALMLTFSH